MGGLKLYGAGAFSRKPGPASHTVSVFNKMSEKSEKRLSLKVRIFYVTYLTYFCFTFVKRKLSNIGRHFSEKIWETTKSKNQKLNHAHWPGHYFYGNPRHFCYKSGYNKMSEKSEKRPSLKVRKFYRVYFTCFCLTLQERKISNIGTHFFEEIWETAKSKIEKNLSIYDKFYFTCFWFTLMKRK